VLVVIALGGNALLRRGEPLDPDVQRRNVAAAAAVVATVALEHRVVVTHGNGPQVGLLALQNEAVRDAPRWPLDVLDAQSAGMLGYLLEQELGRHLGADRVATLLTQVVVDADDPAFSRPSKPVGPVYTEDEAKAVATERGWAVAPDGASWRRVVASPEPRRLVGLATVRRVVAGGTTVVCAGGGGIPVVADGRGGLRGVEAVVDKDLSAGLLARGLEADALVILTDVAHVVDGWGTAHERPLGETTPAELRRLDLAAGSMGPKVEAACRFVESGGRFAVIGSLDDAAAVVRGEAGTVVRPALAPATRAPC
jgi:carbamate kinase